MQTCEPLFFAIVHGEEDFLRLYEFERTKKIYYQIDFRLPNGSKNLYAHIKIINDENYKKPMYWWTNIAVREEKNIRIFSSTEDIIYIYPDSVGSTENSIKKFGASKLPKTPFFNEGSYPLNFPYSSEYFFQTKKTGMINASFRKSPPHPSRIPCRIIFQYPLYYDLPAAS